MCVASNDGGGRIRGEAFTKLVKQLRSAFELYENFELNLFKRTY